MVTLLAVKNTVMLASSVKHLIYINIWCWIVEKESTFDSVMHADNSYMANIVFTPIGTSTPNVQINYPGIQMATL